MMSEVLHANIFFFIASAGVVVFTILVCVAMYQVIKILRTLRRLIERVEAGSEALASDMVAVREYVAAKGSFFAQLISFFAGSSAKKQRKKNKATTRTVVITED